MVTHHKNKHLWAYFFPFCSFDVIHVSKEKEFWRPTENRNRWIKKVEMNDCHQRGTKIKCFSYAKVCVWMNVIFSKGRSFLWSFFFWHFKLTVWLGVRERERGFFSPLQPQKNVAWHAKHITRLNGTTNQWHYWIMTIFGRIESDICAINLCVCVYIHSRNGAVSYTNNS